MNPIVSMVTEVEVSIEVTIVDGVVAVDRTAAAHGAATVVGVWVY